MEQLRTWHDKERKKSKDVSQRFPSSSQNESPYKQANTTNFNTIFYQ